MLLPGLQPPGQVADVCEEAAVRFGPTIYQAWELRAEGWGWKTVPRKPFSCIRLDLDGEVRGLSLLCTRVTIFGYLAGIASLLFDNDSYSSLWFPLLPDGNFSGRRLKRTG